MSLLLYEDKDLDYKAASLRLRGYCATKINKVSNGAKKYPELISAINIDIKLSALSIDANASIAIEELEEILKDAKSIQKYLEEDLKYYNVSTPWVLGSDITAFYTLSELQLVEKDLILILNLLNDAIVNSTKNSDIEEARARASTGRTTIDLGLIVDKSSLAYLVKKYNKYGIWSSPSANENNGTFLRLGPLTYGGEVQDIKILENKAIAEISAIRSNTSFIADSGQSDADIQVSLVFSGQEHILAGFRPLIALFKIAPIISVKNEMINKALENIFTENEAIIPKHKILQDFKESYSKHTIEQNQAALVNTYNSVIRPQDDDGHYRPATYGEIEEILSDPSRAGLGPGATLQDIWDRLIESGGYPAGVHWDGVTRDYIQKYPTFEKWKEAIIDRNLDIPASSMTDPDNLPVTITSDPIMPPDPSYEAEDRIDNTGHVPVAFVNMSVSTHPELPESIVVDLFLKRINVRNYLKDFLQYRTINNTPTSDPTKAFWLNRAIDLYIEKYMKDKAIDFSKVRLEFKGNKIELDSFKGSHPELTKLDLNNTDDSVVSQLSYSITNHFSFHKLLGEAYPTAQFMGSSANGLSMTILTNDRTAKSTFEKIHTYASAADFFARHTDRFNRLQGWDVDCFMTDFFSSDNPSEKGTGTDPDTVKKDINIFDPNRKLYYPKTISSLTVPESPGLKTIHITFAETSPDWFFNFGFTLKQGSYNIGNLYKVYRIFLKHADEFLVDKMSPDTIVGGTLDYQANAVVWNISGNEDAKLNLFNSDTLVAAMIESRTYIGAPADPDEKDNPDSSGGTLGIKENIIGKDLYAQLLGEENWSGLKIPETGLPSVFDVVEDLLRGVKSAFVGTEITRDLAYRMIAVQPSLPFLDSGDPAGETEYYAKLSTQRDEDIKNLPATSDAFFIVETEEGRKELANFLVRIPEKAGRDDLWKYLRSHRLTAEKAVQFTNNYIDRIFAAIVRRRKPILNERLYSTAGVISAWEALIIAFEASSAKYFGKDEIPSTEPDLMELDQLGASLSEKKSSETMIVVDAEGRVRKTSQLTTAYPDYPYITFLELFDLDEPNFLNNWTRYGYSYQAMGILNLDPEAYGGDVQAAVLRASSTRNAQRRLITNPGSPIPPSIFFWREEEFDPLWTDLDEINQQYFNKLSSLIIHIPYGIDGAVYNNDENSGEVEPGEETIDKSGIDPDGDDPDEAVRLKGLARITGDYMREVKRMPESMVEDASRAITTDQIESLMAAEGISSWSELAKKLKKGNIKKEWYLALKAGQGLAGTKDSKKNGILVPTPLYSFKNAPIGTYTRFAGVNGEAIATAIQLQHLDNMGSSSTWETYTNQLITASAAGMESPSQSGANVSETRTTMQKIMQKQKDIGNDLIRAFPAFRMYLIDFKGPRIVVQDTTYGYNALESVDITLDKNDAALAVIRLADPYGLLQGTYFGIQQANGNYIAGEALATSDQNADAGDILKRIKLKQGRAIQLRGGYSSDPDNLDILFTGRIAEIQFGDVTTIVAQGWKAELISKEVAFEETRKEGLGIQDLVISAIRHANPAGLGTVFSGVELSFLNTFRTSLSSNEAMFHTIGVQTGTPSFGTAGAGYQGATIFGIKEGAGRGLDMRLKNIWIPDVNGTMMAQFGYGSIINAGWDSERWIVPLQSVWDVLQTATNYCWGYVCQVVPYDTEATVFFGKPDEMYFHTRGDSRKSNFYKRLQAETLREAGKHFRTIIKEWIKSGTDGWFRSDDTVHRLLQDLQQDQNYRNNEGRYDRRGRQGSSIPFRDSGHRALKLTNNSFGAWTQVTKDVPWTQGSNFAYVAGGDGIVTIPNSHKAFLQAMQIALGSELNLKEWLSQSWLIERTFGGDYITIADKILKEHWNEDLTADYQYLVEELGQLTPSNLLAAFYNIRPNRIKYFLSVTPDSLIRTILMPHDVWSSEEYAPEIYRNAINLSISSADSIVERQKWVANWSRGQLETYIMSIDDALASNSLASYSGKFTPKFATSAGSNPEPFGSQVPGREGGQYVWGMSVDFDNPINLDKQDFLKMLLEPLARIDAEAWSNNNYIKYKFSNSNRRFGVTFVDSRTTKGGNQGEQGFTLENLNVYFSSTIQWPDPKNHKWVYSGSDIVTIGVVQDSLPMIEGLMKGARSYYAKELALISSGAKEESLVANDVSEWTFISNMISFNTDYATIPAIYQQYASFSPLKLLSEDLSFRNKLLSDTHAIGFRSFVHFFARYLKNIDGGTLKYSDNSHAPQSTEYLKTVGKFDWQKSLNMRVFRDYHYILSHRDIIQNNIAATTREMHNTVVVKYPSNLETSNDGYFHSLGFNSFKTKYTDVQVESGTEWTTFPKDDDNIGMQFDPTIAFENKKISVYTDMNCSRVDQAGKIATNWLAKRMRPMYRGNVLLTGRAIKPWDLMILNDKYTEMYGPLEVERVVHHFNNKVGWVTNIIPHAVCNANPGNKIVQEAIFANRMDQIFDTIDLATWAITIGLAIPTGGLSLGAGLAGKAAIGTAIKEGIKASAFSTARVTFQTAFGVAKNSLMTQGKRALLLHLGSATGTYGLGEISKLFHVQSGMIDHQLPCFLSPLIYKGAPLVAGLEASEYTTMSIGARMHWALRDAYDGMSSLMRIAFDGFSPDANSSASLIQGAFQGRPR